MKKENTKQSIIHLILKGVMTTNLPQQKVKILEGFNKNKEIKKGNCKVNKQSKILVMDQI